MKLQIAFLAWNVNSINYRRVVRPRVFASAVFSPDGQVIVTTSKDQTAGVFRVVTLSEIAELLEQ